MSKISVANGQFWWNGYLDEIRMWNIVRTQEEIQATMNKTLTGNEPGLVAYETIFTRLWTLHGVQLKNLCYNNAHHA